MNLDYKDQLVLEVTRYKLECCYFYVVFNIRTEVRYQI